MIRSVFHRLAGSLRLPAGVGLDRDASGVRRVIEELDRQLDALRRELEAETGRRLREAPRTSPSLP